MWLCPVLAKMAYARGCIIWLIRKYCCTPQRVWKTDQSEAAFVTGEVLTKAIQACLTSPHSYNRNAGSGKSLENAWDSEVPPGGAHYPHGPVGIEGWDTVNLAEWDVLPPPPKKKKKYIYISLTMTVRGGWRVLAFNFPIPPEGFKTSLRVKNKVMKSRYTTTDA